VFNCISGMSSDVLREIVRAWQAGAFSQDTMLELFRKGEILPDGRSNSEEVALLNSKAFAVHHQRDPAYASRGLNFFNHG